MKVDKKPLAFRQELGKLKEEFKAKVKEVNVEEAEKLGQELLTLIKGKNFDEKKKTDFDKAVELLYAGANVESKTSTLTTKSKSPTEKTGLIVCAEEGFQKLFRAFLVAGADINAVSNFGSTSLMWSARKGHKDILTDLIVLDADLNVQAKDGDCALHSATRHKQAECVELLIKAGCVLTLKNDKGETSYNLAVTSGDEKTIALFEEYLCLETSNKQKKFCTLKDITSTFEEAEKELKQMLSK